MNELLDRLSAGDRITIERWDDNLVSLIVTDSGRVLIGSPDTAGRLGRILADRYAPGPTYSQLWFMAVDGILYEIDGRFDTTHEDVYDLLCELCDNGVWPGEAADQAVARYDWMEEHWDEEEEEDGQADED